MLVLELHSLQNKISLASLFSVVRLWPLVANLVQIQHFCRLIELKTYFQRDEIRTCRIIVGSNTLPNYQWAGKGKRKKILREKIIIKKKGKEHPRINILIKGGCKPGLGGKRLSHCLLLHHALQSLCPTMHLLYLQTLIYRPKGKKKYTTNLLDNRKRT